jgi:DNA-binding winged helix-turn-helix (wHTH) protein
MATKGPEPGSEPGARPSTWGPEVLRFGVFEIDLRSAELRKSGALVKLQQQPFKVLALLVCRPGDLVTREEIRSQIWGDTYVDFDQGLNFCIKQIRTALGDQADTPRYIETLPRRGYRFIAPVEKREPRLPAAVVPGPRAVPLRAVTPAEAPGRPSAEPATARRRSLVAVGAALALLVPGVAFWLGSRTASAPVPDFQRLTFRRGDVQAARFAPDGDVVYTAAWDGQPDETYATRKGAADTRTLGFPWSRVVGVAGSELALLLTRENAFPVLARAPLAGGPPREILEGVLEADWSADGSSFAVARRVDEKTRIEYPAGQVLLESSALRVTDLRLSPRGAGVAFFEHPLAGDDRGYVVFLDRRGRKKRLTPEWGSLQGLAWSPAGDEVWFTGAQVGADSALHAVDLSGRVRLLAQAPGRLVLHDVSGDGRVLLSRLTHRFELRVLPPGASSERDLSWLDLPWLADLSADGKTVLFGESGEAGGPGYTVFLRATDGRPPVRLGEGRPFALSPDGKWVITMPVDPPQRIVLLPTGAGEPRVVRHPGLQDYRWVDWLPDGRRILFVASEGGKPSRIFVQDVGGGAPRPVTPEGVAAGGCRVTPDGRYVAATPVGSSLSRMYPVDGGEPRPIPGLEPGDQPLRWEAGGRRLYVRRGVLPVKILRIDLGTGRRDPWRDLAPPDPAGVKALGRIVVTPDGGAYAYNYPRFLSDLYVVENLR